MVTAAFSEDWGRFITSAAWGLDDNASFILLSSRQKIEGIDGVWVVGWGSSSSACHHQREMPAFSAMPQTCPPRHSAPPAFLGISQVRGLEGAGAAQPLPARSASLSFPGVFCPSILIMPRRPPKPAQPSLMPAPFWEVGCRLPDSPVPS